MKLPPNTTIPAVAKPRAPYRSDKIPDIGPAMRKSGRQRQQEDAGP